MLKSIFKGHRARTVAVALLTASLAVPAASVTWAAIEDTVGAPGASQSVDALAAQLAAARSKDEVTEILTASHMSKADVKAAITKAQAVLSAGIEENRVTTSSSHVVDEDKVQFLTRAVRRQKEAAADAKSDVRRLQKKIRLAEEQDKSTRSLKRKLARANLTLKAEAAKLAKLQDQLRSAQYGSEEESASGNAELFALLTDMAEILTNVQGLVDGSSGDDSSIVAFVDTTRTASSQEDDGDAEGEDGGATGALALSNPVTFAAGTTVIYVG